VNLCCGIWHLEGGRTESRGGKQQQTIERQKDTFLFPGIYFTFIVKDLSYENSNIVIKDFKMPRGKYGI